MNLLKAIRHIFIFSGTALACLCCSPDKADSNKVSGNSDPQAISEEYIRNLGKTDLDGAMYKVTEGASKGIFTPLEANLLRAKLFYQYSEDYDQALQWCQEALMTKEAQEDSLKRLEVLRNIQTIAQTKKDYPAMLSACRQGQDLARSLGLELDGLAFDYAVGRCMYYTGQQEEGLRVMEESVEKALKMVKTQSEYGHWITCIGNLTNTYVGAENWQKAIQKCDQQQKVLQEMALKFPQDEFSTNWGDRVLFYSRINKAISLWELGQAKQAENLFSQALKQDYASTSDGVFRQSGYYAKTGRPDKVTECLELSPYSGLDTVDRRYVSRLSRLEEAYRVAKDSTNANLLAERIAGLNRQIEEIESRTVAADVEGYKSKNYKFKINDLSATLKTNNIILIALSALILVLLIAGTAQYINKYRRRKTINTILSENIKIKKEIETLRSLIAVQNPKTEDKDRQVSSLVSIFKEKQFFLNKMMSISMAAGLLGCSQRELRRMIEAIEPGMTFPRFISSLRIDYAKSLMEKEPSLPVSEIADQSGFYSTRTFQRTFLATTGQTPSDYRSKQKND